jgi:hypothetical protein
VAPTPAPEDFADVPRPELQRRLDAIEVRRDRRLAVSRADEDDALARRLLAAPDPPLDLCRLLGWLRWYAYHHSDRRLRPAREQATELLSRVFLAGHEPLPRLLAPELADEAEPEARTRLDEAERSRDPGACGRALALWERIVRHSRQHGPEYAARLFALGRARMLQHGLTGTRDTLRRAAAAISGAADLGSPYDVEQATYLVHAGDALRSQAGPEEVRRALAYYDAVLALRAAPTPMRIRAARSAAALRDDPDDAAGDLRTAVELLPLVAPRHLARAERMRELGGFPALARDAAATELRRRGGSASTALGLLELGRNVLMHHDLTAHSDLTDLERLHPQQAAEFRRLRDFLDEDAPDRAAGASAEQLQERRIAAAARFDALLAEIRHSPGFAGFGLPPGEEELTDEAREGTLVVLTTSSYGSDALVVRPEGVTRVALTGVGAEEVTERATAFQRRLHTARDADTSRPALLAYVADTLAWLRAEVVGPVLTAAPPAPARAGRRARLWWIPCGPFTWLPVHAAAAAPRQGAGREAGRDAARGVVSSYTPSIRALHHARRRDAARRADGVVRSLIVAAPRAPGAPDLPETAREAAALRGLLPGRVRLDGPDDTSAGPAGGTADGRAGGSPATAEAVLDHLRTCSVAHFACHGVTDEDDPSRSRLLLGGPAAAEAPAGERPAARELTVARLQRAEFRQARLAYLSACRTARTDDPRLLDESVHLASALQVAGFPQVIGTLWEVGDGVAAGVARRFYDRLRMAPGAEWPAAEALDDAVEAVATEGAGRSEFQWAPFVHLGI